MNMDKKGTVWINRIVVYTPENLMLTVMTKKLTDIVGTCEADTIVRLKQLMKWTFQYYFGTTNYKYKTTAWPVTCQKKKKKPL